jgi:hypothetical protein
VSTLKTAGLIIVVLAAASSGGGASESSRQDGPASEPSRTLRPRDDAASDAGLQEVRRQVRLAVAKRDVSLLLPVLATEVLVDHGVRVPRDQVVSELMKWTPAKQQELWRDLRDAMDLGIAIKGPGDAYAPYLFVTLEEDEVAIVGADVKAHETPSIASRTIATLSHAIVRRAEGTGDSEETVKIDGYPYVWRRIVTPSGKQGWVPQKYARQATDSGFWFTKVGGHWKLASFVVED